MLIDSPDVTGSLLVDGEFHLPAGPTNKRSTEPFTGSLRFNTDSGSLELYDGVGWSGVEGRGGGTRAGLLSSSAQIDGFISQNGNFVANETIIATGTNSVTSSNILALDTTNNYLGINQSNPEVTLHMTGDGAQTAQIRMEQYNDSADAPDVRTRKARGTSALPAKNNAGDFIYRQNSERYNGSAYTTVGQFAVDANSSNADRFQLTLTVSEDGNTIDAAAAQFKIDGNNGGAIKFNDSYYFPTSDGTNGQALITNGSGVLSFGGSGAGFPFSGSAVITGSLYVSGGNISGSFVGDGAGITGVTINQFATVEDTFTNATSHSVVHNFGTKNVFVQVFESDDTLLMPYSITTTDINTVDIVLGDTLSGRVVIGKAGHILQDTGNFVSSSTAVQTFTNATTASINHYLDSFNVITQVFDSNNNVIVPSNIKVATKDRVDITFASSRSGKVVIAKAGHIVQGTSENAVSASFSDVSKRVRAGSSGSRPTDYANIATGSLWYNTDTLALEAFTGVSGSWWQSIGSASLNAPVNDSFSATGGTITTSGNYTYHTFTSSSPFIVNSGTKNIDYLIIAGGGGAGDGDNATNTGGGGGAGGIILTTNTSITSGTHTVTVGAGGSINTNGDDSSFNSTTATGGGSGGTPTGNDSGGSGGSGGGAGPGGSAGSSTAGQGNDGGASDSRCGGGGGGTGAVGGNVTVSGDGAPGGDGVNTYSEWATATSTGASGYYGGGGGSGDPANTNLSGPGGAGGGGNGGYQGGTTEERNGQPGTANTGGGGGSAADNTAYVSAAGGSGLVIIRYLT